MDRHEIETAAAGLAAQLTAEGVATSTGRTWHASTVRAILGSETVKQLVM